MTLTELPPIDWTFGDVLTKIRTNANLTVEQLAELTDISPRSVGNYEKDRTFPKWSTVLRWAEACRYPHVEELRSTWDAARRSGWINAPPQPELPFEWEQAA